MSLPPTDGDSLSARFRRSVPWDARDLLALYAATFVGLFLVFVAWFGSSGAAHLRSQVRWTNVGVAGVIVLGAGNLWWLLRARRATGALRRQVLPLVLRSPELWNAGPHTAGRASKVGDALVAGPGMTRFHRAGCALAAGKDVRAASESAHRRAGREPCGVCDPVES